MQKKLLFIFLCTCIFYTYSCAIGLSDSSASKWSVVGGVTISTIHISSNLQNVPHWGKAIRVYYMPYRAIRFSTEYNSYFKHNILPVWKDVRSYDIGLYGHYVASFTNYAANFYATLGLSIQNWKAIYSDQSLLWERDKKMALGDLYTANRYSIGAGLGFEKQWNNLSFFMELKYKISKKELNVPVSIIDIIYTAGLKYTLPTFSYRHKKVNFLRDKYHWF